MGEFRCHTCDMTFFIGHYCLDRSSGYAAHVGAICARCMSQHHIWIAVPDRGPRHFRFFDVKVERVEDDQRVRFMAALRRMFGMSLNDAKRLTNGVPILIARDTEERTATALRAKMATVGAATSAQLVHLVPNRAWGPIMPDRLVVLDPMHGEREIALGEPRIGFYSQFDLGQMACGNCGEPGSISSERSAVPDECPRCGDSIVASRTFTM